MAPRSYLTVPGHQQFPYVDPDYLIDGGTNNVRQSMARRDVSSDLAALTTQVMLSVAMPLQVGDVISTLAFRSGGTAADTPTNWWFALYSNAATPAKLAQTADQTTTAWAADDVKEVALTAAQEITEAGVYYVAIMMKATAVVSLAGRAVDHAEVSTGLLSGQKVLAQTSGSSLTTTAPATIATPTAVVNVPWCAAY